MKEYLPSLIERKKWRTPKENLKVGDLVLLVDTNYRRGEWPTALVVVRTVRVKTMSTVATYVKRQKRRDIKTSYTVLTRPVTSLCRLELDE